MSACTEERFLMDVGSHVMEVLRDDGVYRHIRFKKPGTGCMHFDLVTWPGYLAYSGDMGCYVFSRLDDMFEFFRTDRRYSSGRLGINLGYWSEKLQAVDGNRDHASAKEFSEDKFKRVINEYRLEWVRKAAREHLLSRDERRELWEAVDKGVPVETGGDAAIAAACAFSWPPPWQTVSGAHSNARWQFEDLWEHDFTNYTFHFVWCCYALAWGIKTYDEAKEKEALIDQTGETIASFADELSARDADFVAAANLATILDLIRERREARAAVAAEREACADLLEALQSILQIDAHGTPLQDRLRFWNAGRPALDKALSAIAKATRKEDKA